MSSESDKGRRDGGVRNVKALFEGRTTPAGPLEAQTRRDRKGLGVERWRGASQSGDIGGKERRPGVPLSCRATGWRRVQWAGWKRASNAE